MGDIADVYQETRERITKLVSELPEDDLTRHVPATPAWTIKDVVGHLCGDVANVNAGSFPREFFEDFGSEVGVEKLNEWTEAMVTERRGRPLLEILDEWERESKTLVAAIRGEQEWHADIPALAGNVLITDACVHEHDLYGALGLERERDSAPVKIGFTGYVVSMGWRLGAAGLAPLRFEAPDKTISAGEGEPGATVRATRWEFFRAMSGRRNPDQIRAYDWTGDPEPYIPYFYPYGVRADALTE
jgi:uncharacterized protein (TIGR03083 family)